MEEGSGSGLQFAISDIITLGNSECIIVVMILFAYI